MSTNNHETQKLSLFAILLGCTPQGRNIEQHDMMFGVAHSLNDLTGHMKTFWHKPMLAKLAADTKKIYPDIDTQELEQTWLTTVMQRDKVHIDGWVQVNYADGYRVEIIPKSTAGGNNGLRLYFINLGGYKAGEFEELHKKFFVVAANMHDAMTKAKSHDFMKEYANEGTPHLDDQHKIDFEADDIICVSDMLNDGYVLQMVQVNDCPENELNMGYIKLNYAE